MNYLSFTVSTVSLFFLIFIILSTLNGVQQQQAFTETPESLWTYGNPMPTPRTEVAASVIEDNIYVMGGLDKSGKVLDIVEVYNIKNDSWKSLASLPQPLHHTAASSLNSKIYVIGGSSSPIDNWIPTDKLFIYDPIEDNWTEGKPMPTARGSVNENFIDGILYVTGGYGSSQIVNVNEAYDPSSNVWISKSPMPTPRHHAASAVVDDQLFVIGGRIVGLYPIVNTNITERYDPKEDKWITLEPMPSKRSGISATAVAVNNNTTTSIYVFGGEDLTKTYNNNEKYDVKSNKWMSQEPMPTARHGLAAVTTVNDDNKIYVIGGGPASGLSVTNVNEIFNIR